jgi:hypothetical protein
MFFLSLHRVDFCDVFLYGCSVTSLKSLVTQRRRRLTKSWRLAYAYLSYYGSNPDVQVVGIDPNLEMEKYARSSAASAGLPLSNFEFIHAVCNITKSHWFLSYNPLLYMTKCL